MLVRPSDDIHIDWGVKGHQIINHLASENLPQDMPDFFLQGSERITNLASFPDRWKIGGLEVLDDSNRPDHFISSERVGKREFPPVRSQFMEMLVRQNIGTAGKVASTVGFLPYRMAEMFELMVAEFARYRTEVERNGSSTPYAEALQDDLVRNAGIMGHFVGDAAQPLHVTVHHDGWDESVEPNPDGFTTKPGIHGRFEIGYVNHFVEESDVAPRLHPARELQGDPLELALAFVKDSRSYVRRLYVLEKAGKISVKKPSPETTELAVSRQAAGAQFLSDLWYTAWKRSAALAGTEPEPSVV